jgi:hypothetical protein
MSASMHMSDKRGDLSRAKSLYRRESLDKNSGYFRTGQITAKLGKGFALDIPSGR